MLINPRSLLAVSTVAAQEPGRYALNAVHIERRPSTSADVSDMRIQLTATNGKVLLRATIPEPDAAQLPDGGIAHQKDADRAPVSVLLGVTEATRAAKDATKNKRPWSGAGVNPLGCVGIEESTINGTATIETWSDLSPTKVTVETTSGHYPPIDDVIPAVSDASHASVTLDARYLRDLCDAILDAAGPTCTRPGGKRKGPFDACPTVTIHVSRRESAMRAVRIDAGHVIGEMIGVIMPITK